jgi:mRNA-degrading endonuclease RelE of RelBE toxin-antitoxin system
MDTTRYRIAFTEGFQRALVKLDPDKLARTHEAILKLGRGMGATRLHKLEGSGFCSFGVNQDAYRVICQREGDLLLLVHVGPHDAAYAWADRHRVVQVGDAVRVIRSTLEVCEEETPTLDPAHALDLRPFRDIKPRRFAWLDVGPRAAEVLAEVPDEDALIELLECFRAPLATALLELATDPQNLDAIVNVYRAELAALAAAPEPPTPRTLAESLTARVNSADVWLAPDSADALAAALTADLEAWRVFLHPTQRRLVEQRGRGAYKVTGGPGTGKTVVALHRARFLAERAFTDDPRPVLLTTYSRVLARDLERGLTALCADRPELLDRIEVSTLTRVATDTLREANQPHLLLRDRALDDAWRDAMRADTLGRPLHFYRAEREHVVARHGSWTASLYIRKPRRGRPGRMGRAAKKEAWKVLSTYESALAARGGGDAAALARDATLAVATGEATQRYCAIVCDELQDVSAPDLRLLAALARDPDEGTIRPDALFLVGDAYQSLYRRPIALSHCGVEVRGRSTILRHNYRTTEGIRRAAIERVRDVTFADDERDEGDALLDGYVSYRSGARPTEHTFTDAAGEADLIATHATDPDAPPGPLLVLARTNTWLDRLESLLRERGLQPRRLGPNDAPSRDDTLLMCTLHRAKGLEAPRVFIAGAQLCPRPFPGGDDTERAVWERQERCLLYVGITRARDQCVISRVTSV